MSEEKVNNIPPEDEELAKAYARRQKQKQEEEERTVYSPEDKLSLLIGKYVVIRAVDVPAEVNYSFIKCDDDKLRMFKFPPKDMDPQHIMYRICDKVLARVYRGKNAKGEAQWEYPVEKINPEIFRMVQNNGNVDKGKYGYKGWMKESGYPEKACYVNAINRMLVTSKVKDESGNEIFKEYGPNWCYENNHTLLLVKSNTAIGVPITVNNLLMDNMIGDYGPYYHYDVAIKRLNSDPWYHMVKAETLTSPEHQELQKCVVVGMLTDKDRALEKYDTKAMSAPTPFSVLYQHLSGKIENIDKALGTTYLDELKSKVDQEKELSTDLSTETRGSTEQPAQEQAAQPAPGTAGAPQVDDTSSSSQETPAQPAQEQTAQPVQEQAAQPAPNPNQEAAATGIAPDLLAKAPFVSKITEVQRKLIKGVEVDNSSGRPVKKVVFTTADQAPCPKCNQNQPTDIDIVCIFCGASFV